MNLKHYWQEISNIKNLRNFFLIDLLVIFGLNLNLSIFFLYPLSLGLNFLEMMFVYFSLTRLVYLIALIPTGVIADKYSTKLCICFTFAAYAAAYIFRGTLPFIMLPIVAFVISEIIMGLADASLIGANDKFLYSFRKQIKDSKIFSLNHSLIFIMRAAACLVGALIVFLSSMRWTQIIGGIIIFVGFVFSLFFIKEPKYKKQEVSSKEIYKEGFLYALKHKKTLCMIIGLSLLGLGIFASRNVFQPMLASLGLDIENFAVAFGLIFTVQMLFTGFGSFIVQKIEKKVRMPLAIFATLVVMAILLFTASFAGSIVALMVLIWLFSFTEGSQYTQTTIQLNRYINKESQRATINSISSLVSAILLVVFIPVIGKLTDLFGMKINLYISSALILVGAIVIYLPNLKKQSTPQHPCLAEVER